jgi:hypothetical protein
MKQLRYGLLFIGLRLLRSVCLARLFFPLILLAFNGLHHAHPDTAFSIQAAGILRQSMLSSTLTRCVPAASMRATYALSSGRFCSDVTLNSISLKCAQLLAAMIGNNGNKICYNSWQRCCIKLFAARYGCPSPPCTLSQDSLTHCICMNIECES